MKKILSLLITVLMSSSCLGAGGGPMRVVFAECEHCTAPVSAGNEMGEGITGYERQVQRGLEPAMKSAQRSSAR
ncbi:hypothetical protein [Pantoea sp. CCBC3-3-1]|uniref:hypothetical protein n=1 Tax=Pantoea sp. CCBC3-3-1 TaxID=2490851 RepID=UPI0011BDA65E|nr:hypothetical protein [Pantoea sp. CCBC3-3-1]